LAEAQPLLAKLNDKQKEFIFSPKKYTAYYGGIRNGKSWAGCAKGLALSDQFPGNVGVVARLTYQELIDTTQKDFLSFVKIRNGGNLQPGPYVKRFIEGPPATLTLQNGSEIRFRYADNPDAILGATLGWFYIDQAEFVPEKVYSALEGRLSLWGPQRIKECQEAYLNLYKIPLKYVPREFGFITGNPAPGWVYKRYKLNPSGVYHMVEATTAANEANLPADYLASLRSTNTEEWVQRYLQGSWDVFSGQIYKDWNESLHGIKPMEIPAHWPRFIGWDHGQQNATAVSFVSVDEEGNAVLYKEHYKVNPDITQHAADVKALCIGDPVRRSDDGKGIVVFMDPSTSGRADHDGRDFQQLYADLGIYGIGANNRVNAGIQKVQSLLMPDPNHKFPKWHPRAGQLGSPRFFVVTERCPAFCHEIALYKWMDQPDGKEENYKEKPHKYLDHMMDAVRYTVMAIFEAAIPIKKDEIPTYAQQVQQQMLNDLPAPTEDPDW
jgi:hypothetical protein